MSSPVRRGAFGKGTRVTSPGAYPTLNPLTYLTYLFEQLPNIDLKDPEALDQLLPWADAIQAQFHIPVKSRPNA